MNKIILASASPRRRELLQQIGMEFEVIPAVGEEKLPAGSGKFGEKGPAPWEIVEILSAQKAGEIFLRFPEEKEKSTLVIGADTVVALEGEVMGKPKNRQEAVSMLSRLAGKSHQVYTGVTLMLGAGKDRPPRAVTFHEKTDVFMYPMSGEEISAYVDTGEPMDKAGAYGIQGRCAAFIREIHGDYNNVVGLPVSRLYQEMKRMRKA